MLAPRWTTGPSRPVEAPLPSESAEITAERRPSVSDIRPPCSALASITSATPWGRWPGIPT